MDLEYMSVGVDGMTRRFPMSHVKVTWKPSDQAITVAVFVIYPSYTIEGHITREAMNDLFDYGKRTGIKVVSSQYEYDAMMDYIQDIKYGKLTDTDDDVTKAMRHKWSNA